MSTRDHAAADAAILALTSFVEGWHAWGNADVIECTLLGGIDRPLTLTHLDTALAELEQLREQRDEAAPVMPDPRGPEHQRVATDWHTVSAIARKSWTDDGYEWNREYDIEHPDECDLLPYGQECLFDRLVTLFGLDDEELSFGPRQARAQIYGPDMNGDFEEHIEWGKDVESAPQPEQAGEAP